MKRTTNPSPHVFLAFVDHIENEKATLIFYDPKREPSGYTLSTCYLPAPLTEGNWVEISVQLASPPTEIENQALRKQLGQKDTGKDFSL